jgi:gluconokinase
MGASVVVMGVSGCGKSALAAAVAAAEGLPLIEGDAFHPEANRDKMRRGIALTDEDRAGWLDTLGGTLREHAGGAVLACSALKRAYRDRLRAASPGLRFVFLEIGREDARARVAARGQEHFFSPALVDNQFETLEPPPGEPGVLCVDAMAPLAGLQVEVSRWLRGMPVG